MRLSSWAAAFTKMLAAIVMVMIMPVMVMMPMSNSNDNLCTRWNCQRCEENQEQ